MLLMSESLMLAIFALPVLGFVLGALWMRQKMATQLLRQPHDLTPIPLRQPGLETQLLDALDSVQSQLSELAERQDFTERVLTRKRGRAGARRDHPAAHPDLN